jgi:hypothetical protein
MIRLLTPLGMRYDETYTRAFPFDRLIDDLFNPVMVDEVVKLIQKIWPKMPWSISSSIIGWVGMLQ